MQAGKHPTSIGLMFSLGHSTIVLLASAGIAATALIMRIHMESFSKICERVGTLVSTVFLFTIALLNLIILRSVIWAFGRVQRGEPYVDEDFDMLLADRCFLSRMFRPSFRLITKIWHIYFLGFLFGLGLDTATEVGVLGIWAASAAQGTPVWSILVFPVLFMAGMTLIDTTDSILMLGAYGWTFVKPIRKLYYNITITGISVAAALLVDSIEGLGLLANILQLSGGFWDVTGSINNKFGLIGYLIIGVFICSWVCSVLIYRWKRIDELKTRSRQIWKGRCLSVRSGSS